MSKRPRALPSERASERRGSRHDHNVVPGTQSALNVRAYKDRLPQADYITRAVLTMPGWDACPTDRDAARARLEHARANFKRTVVARSNQIGR